MQRKGRLKIFFGYCAGVGKTYSMLKEAHEKAQEGVDVVIGYIEPHDRKETISLIDGLEQLDKKEILYKKHRFYELDLDLALQRHPKLILVDELAHTNAIGSRHKNDIVILKNCCGQELMFTLRSMFSTWKVYTIPLR